MTDKAHMSGANAGKGDTKQQPTIEDLQPTEEASGGIKGGPTSVDRAGSSCAAGDHPK